MAMPADKDSKMLENTAKNIANGIILQVVDIPNKGSDTSKRKKHTDIEITEDGKTTANEKKPSSWRKDAKTYLTMFIAETIGTGLLMFLGCMGCITQVDDPPAVHHMSSLSFGLVIMLIIQTVGHVSGAHLNPAVTIATVIFKIITIKMGVVYVVGQFIGGIAGFALLRVLIPPEWGDDGFCMTLPHERITAFQALAIEIIITTVLIMVCCAVWDPRNKEKQDSTPLRFGLIIAAISMVSGPLTGASMNTVRSIAPAILARDFTDQWIYFVGPNLAAFIGCGIYHYAFGVPETDEGDKDESIRLEDTSNPAKV